MLVQISNITLSVCITFVMLNANNLRGRLGGLCCIWTLPRIGSHKMHTVKYR